MAKIHNNTVKHNGEMGTIITGLVGAFIGITVWEMGRKLIKESNEGIKRQNAFDPHDEIYH